MKKFKLNWQSVVVGMVLCAVLGVFIGSKAAGPQVVTRADTQRIASTSDLYEKTVAMEARVVAIDERLIRMETKIAAMNECLVRIEHKIDTNDKEMVPARRHIEVILDGIRTLLKEKK